MMQELRNAALVGTARQGIPALRLEPEIDALIEALPDTSPERKLLLTMGIVSLYRQAGRVPGSMPALPAAPEETLDPCSKEAGKIIRSMLEAKTPSYDAVLHGVHPVEQTGLHNRQHADLLPEVFQLLGERRLRLRHVLLPDLLPARTDALREALLRVMGERGRWLARFYPAWAWAMEPYTADRGRAPSLPAEAEQIWQEGKQEYRLDVFKLHRRIDPAGALQRLEEDFRSERAEFRAQLVGALEVGLSSDDGPFLERALDDRHHLVRRQAVRLLVRLPEPTCAQRLQERADSMLTWKPRRLRSGHLEATPPETFDPAWEREGMQATSRTAGVDDRGRWMLETVQLVPVQHWVDRFGAPLEELVAGLSGRWQMEILEAWTAAAVRFGERALMPVLWDGWWKRRGEQIRHPYLLAEMLGELAVAMDPVEADPRLCRLIAEPMESRESLCGQILRQVPPPWPEELAESYLIMLLEIVTSLTDARLPAKPWIYVLAPGARGIPARHIDRALAMLPLPTMAGERFSDRSLAAQGLAQTWRLALDIVTEKLQLRQRFMEEMMR